MKSLGRQCGFDLRHCITQLGTVLLQDTNFDIL